MAVYEVPKTKLEREVERRRKKEARDETRRLRLEAAAKHKATRERELYINKEFHRLFSSLKRMVKLTKCDSPSLGWLFKFNGQSYYISYDFWRTEKTPGDVDDYAQEGYCWVLKKSEYGHAPAERTVTLSHDSFPKHGLTEAVIRGLKTLNPKEAE